MVIGSYAILNLVATASSLNIFQDIIGWLINQLNWDGNR